jgi:hypothetical protein
METQNNTNPASTTPAAAGAGCAALPVANLAAYLWRADPGHAWLMVPLADVRAVRFAPSACSYVNRALGLAYLEEDCDAPGFLRAAGFVGLPELRTVREVHTNDEEPLRRLPAITRADVDAPPPPPTADRVHDAARMIGAAAGLNPADLAAAAGAPMGPDYVADLPAADLRRALSACAPAMSTDENRYILNGAHLELRRGFVSIVATDGRRLHAVQLPADVRARFGDLVAGALTDNAPASVIIPAESVRDMLRAGGPLSASNVKGNPFARLEIGAGPVRKLSLIVADRAPYTSRTVEGNFPKWRAVLPKRDVRKDRGLRLVDVQNVSAAELEAFKSFPANACALPAYADCIESLRAHAGDATANGLRKAWLSAARSSFTRYGRSLIFAPAINERDRDDDPASLRPWFPTYAISKPSAAPHKSGGPSVDLTHYDKSLTAPTEIDRASHVNAYYMADAIAAADDLDAPGLPVIIGFTQEQGDPMRPLAAWSAAPLDSGRPAACLVIMPQRHVNR